MRIVFMLILLLLYGCKNTDIISVEISSGPPCPTFKGEGESNMSYANSFWTCGNRSKALALAKSYADQGDIDSSNLYLGILASHGEENIGLVYAIKGAENGNFESAEWVLRIAKDKKIHSLGTIIYKQYYSFFKARPDDGYLLLVEYLEYAKEAITPTDYTAATYGLAFVSLSKGSKAHIDNWIRIDAAVVDIMKVCDSYGVSKEVVRRAKLLADTEVGG